LHIIELKCIIPPIENPSRGLSTVTLGGAPMKQTTSGPKGLRNGWQSVANGHHITDLLFLGDTLIGRIDPAEDGPGFVGGYLGTNGYTQFNAPNLLFARGEVQKYATGCIGAHCPDLATLLMSIRNGEYVFAGSQLSILSELNDFIGVGLDKLEHFVRDHTTGNIIAIEPSETPAQA